MSDELATDIEVEFDVDPQSGMELSAEWVMYLDEEDPPDLIAGIDQGLRYFGDDAGTAMA